MKARLAALYGRFTSDAMFRNSLGIMSSTVITSLFGYVFWIVVARVGGTEASGEGAAITSAMQATVLFASAGGPNALMERLPATGSSAEWREKYTAVAIMSGAMAALGGAAVAAILGVTGVLPGLDTILGVIAFMLLCLTFAWGLVLDSTLLCDHRSGLLAIKNALTTGLRIPLYFALGLVFVAVDAVLWSWTLAAAITIPLTIIVFGRRRGHEGRSLKPRFNGLSAHLFEMRHSIIGQHMIGVAAQLPTFLLPILVVARLGATDNAYFYAAWMLGAVFFIISPAVSVALFVEGAGARDDIRELAHRSLRTILLLLTGPMLVYLAAGGVFLSMFGPEYTEHARTLLIILTISALPDAVTNVAVAVLRITGRMGAAMWLNITMLVSTVVLAWILLPIMGISGAGVAWLVSQAVGAVWVGIRWRWIVRGGGRHTRRSVESQTAREVVSGARAADN